MCDFIDSNHSLEVFQTWKLADKIQELKDIAKSKKLDVLDGVNVVIAVPSLDESGRSIYMDDKDLFYAQKQDAYKLAEFILKDTKSCLVDVILDADKAIEVSNHQIDYVIFLHEFMDYERDYILGELGDFGYGMPRAIELY